MDPDEALRRLRELCAATGNGWEEAEELAELFRGLDGWLSSGGFPPKAWAGPGIGTPPEVTE